MEPVEVVHHDPRPQFIQPESPLRHGGYLDSVAGEGRRAMGDRYHRDNDVARCGGFSGYDYARAAFYAFFQAANAFVMPQIGVMNDKARLGLGYRHRLAAKFIIKTCVFRRYSGTGDQSQVIIGQIGSRQRLPVEALQTVVFIR